MNTFVHLHTHSYYSLLDGVPSPEELVLAAQKNGMPALALTDHNALYGAVEFYRKAREYHIQPIIGAELTLSDGFNVLLLVKDEQGYRNLCQLITRGRLQGGHARFRLEAREMANLSAGLIALSAGQKGRINALLAARRYDEACKQALHFQQLFNGEFYLELQHFSDRDTLLNLRLRDLSAECRIPLAASNDVHFIGSADWRLRRLLRAIDANTTLEKVPHSGNAEQYFKSAAQMQKLLRLFPQASANTLKIARRCQFEFRLGKPVFPSIELPAQESGSSCLRKKSFEGAARRYKPLTSRIVKRLEFELQTIHDLGFSEYFLIVKDISDFCRREHIPCVGRGSAADSLVAYVLQITQADPIRHNLYFERFLNPGRSDPPDIDLDICWKSRDRVLKYVYQKYGAERTAMICTFNTFQSRSAIREVARAFGLPEDEIARLTRYLPHYQSGGLAEALRTLPELKALRPNLKQYREILDCARRISDFPRHLSIHPGGVIIAPDRLSFYTPLEMAGKDMAIAQYDMYSIEQLGLVKMDLLGVRSLSVISDTLTSLGQEISAGRQKKGARQLLKKSRELSPLDLRAIPENDAEVTAFIRSGQTMGCFQLESPAMRGLLKKMQIDSVDDVITAVALIRPGAAGSGMKEVYIRRRAGLEKATYVHPALEEALAETYGVIIYQEQALRVAHLVAGFSLAQADLLRRAMTKARTKKDFLKLHDAFMGGAQNNGLSAQQAETVWKFLAQFVGYGFNKAHSATYGAIAYQTAFLKRYFPQQYMCAVLNNQGGFYAPMAYVEEVRRLGIPLLPPDVNRSQKEFTCEGDALRVGLQTVRDVTQRTMQLILQERRQRPFSDLFDFIRRTRAGEKEVQHLIKVGALEALHPSAPQLLLNCRIFFRNKKRSAIAEYLTAGVALPPFNLFQKIINELELLGFAVSAHPLTLFEEQLQRRPLISSAELETYKNKRVCLAGWLVASRRVAVKGRQYMKFMTLEDRQGMYEAVLFPAVYARYGQLIRAHGPFVMTGRVQSRLPGEANLIVEQVEALDPPKETLEKMMHRL